MKKLPILVLSASLLLPNAVFATASPSIGNQTQQVTLTYQQAIERALSKSYTLKNSEQDIQRSEEVMQNSADNVKFIPEGPGNPAMNKAFTGYTSSQIGYGMSKRQLTVDQDKISYSTRKAYNDILQALEEKQLASTTLAYDEMLSKIVTVKYQAGLASNVEKTRTYGTYQADKKNLDAADKRLTAAYQTLNQLVGLSPQSRPELKEQIKFDKLPEVDLNGHISRILSENPSLWNAQKLIELKKLQLDLYTFNDPTNEPYEAKKIDVTKAENTYASIKEQTEQGLRDLYQNIRKAEDNYQAVQESLAIAEDGLRATKVQFDIGIATKADLKERELTVAQLKEKMAVLAVAHDNAVQAFYKPWVAGGSTSTN